MQSLQQKSVFMSSFVDLRIGALKPIFDNITDSGES